MPKPIKAEALDGVAEELAATWINGNRSDTVEGATCYAPKLAAYTAARVVLELLENAGADDARAFVDALGRATDY